MAGNIELDFREIRTHEGDKRKGFEELVCQLARRDTHQNVTEFRRIEGSGGDGGVEAYWIFKDGTKHGYQAKYFLATKDIDWSQIDKSIKTALKQHPELTKYTIAIACDLTNRSGKKGWGKRGWEHWDTHKSKWEKWAYSKGMTVEFIPWTKSELTDSLVTSPENRGLVLYWFNTDLFDEAWFLDLFERSKADLAERFQPEDHVEVRLKKAFDGLSRSSVYINFLSKWFNDVPSIGDLSSIINKLDVSLDEKLIQELDQRCKELREIGESIHTFEAKPFPIVDWQNAIKITADAISPIREWLYDQKEKDDDANKRIVQNAWSYLQKIVYHLDTTPIHLVSNDSHKSRIMADLRRSLIVVGEAGSGKSHLFADVVASSLSMNAPAILLLGQYFPGQNIRREFLNCLDLNNQNFETVLQALNAAGEIFKTRLIILIDALNEAHYLRVWPEQLAGFISDILRYEWLAIGVSLRPEYEDVLIIETVSKNSTIEICRGIQSPKEQAAVQYFEKRGITRPAVPWLVPEFSNFLFLKTCCDALQESGIKEFPRGLRGSLNVLKFYLDNIHLKLKRRFPDTEIPKTAIIRSIQKIAGSMACEKVDYVLSILAINICDAEFVCRGPTTTTSWFSVLTSEGVFRRDHIFSDVDKDPFADVQDVYRFTYQRFSDHLIVKELIKDVDDIHVAFQPNGPLGFLLEKDGHWAWSSLWSALSVQIPEKFAGKELLDVLPTDYDKPYMLIEVFKESLLWRSNSAFSERTLDLFNALPMGWSDPRNEVLIRLATLRDHPWNAKLLDSNLQRRPLPERDEFWTVQINNLTEDDSHPLWELINWSLTANLEPVETETLRLSAITIAWMLTSSSPPIRDTATKALISIFDSRLQLIPILLKQFRNVDDLYVLERICASVLGAITRNTDHENIKASARAVYQAVFECETPHLNINLRDYARAVIEYAVQQDCLDDSINIQKCRPPYKSKWPLHDTTEEELDKLAEKAGGKQILYSALNGDFGIYTIPGRVHNFTDVPLNQLRPLSDEEKEKIFKKQIERWSVRKQKAFLNLEIAVEKKRFSLREETGDDKSKLIVFSYPEDAVNLVEKREAELLSLLSEEECKTFKQFILPVLMPERVSYEVRSLPKFDEYFAKRWIAKKSYEYGWDKELFPDDTGRGFGRERPKIERIGKKYQWLALFELMARLSDNVWAIGKWPKRAMIYDHPATDWFVRDIEPSILIDSVEKRKEENWWQMLSLKMEPIETDDLRSWPFQKEPPYTSDWMDIISPDGIPWLLLYGFFISREDRTKKDLSLISFKRKIFIRVSTILVKTDAVEATISKLKNSKLADPSGHETINWTDGPFLCEYPWRNTWQPDYDIYEDDNIGNFSGIRYIRPVAQHVWESHLDLSLHDGSSICVPNPWIGEKLGLKPNLDRIGEFVAETDGKTVFIDPAVGISGSSAALINREKFLSFLKQEKIECLWIVAGELNSWPSGKARDYSCRSFASIYRWLEKDWTGVRWYKDNSRYPNG